MDFDCLVLSREELKLLRTVAQKPAENTEESAQKLDTLINLGFVTFQMYADGGDGKLGAAYFVTDDGNRYLQYLKRRKSETRFANTMSVLAFIVSFIALIVSIIK